jgi:hypothetical protein
LQSLYIRHHAEVNNWLQPVGAFNPGGKHPLVFADKKLCLETLVLKTNLYAGLWVLTAVTMKFIVYFCITLCSLEEIYLADYMMPHLEDDKFTILLSPAGN